MERRRDSFYFWPWVRDRPAPLQYASKYGGFIDNPPWAPAASNGAVVCKGHCATSYDDWRLACIGVMYIYQFLSLRGLFLLRGAPPAPVVTVTFVHLSVIAFNQNLFSTWTALEQYRARSFKPSLATRGKFTTWNLKTRFSIHKIFILSLRHYITQPALPYTVRCAMPALMLKVLIRDKLYMHKITIFTTATECRFLSLSKITRRDLGHPYNLVWVQLTKGNDHFALLRAIYLPELVGNIHVFVCGGHLHPVNLTWTS